MDQVSDFTYERIARTGFADAADEAAFKSTRYERRHCDHCGSVRLHRDHLEHVGVEGMACVGCLLDRMGCVEPPTTGYDIT